MELSIKHITNNFSTALPDTIELLKYDDEYQLLSSASDELISSISFEHFNTHICIHDVWTDPDMRRCGYARLLLTELIQDWKNDSLNNSHDNTIIPLILHVSGSNMPAVRLYKSSGFVVREELKYYNVK
jgi:ribosomal protein S18 acetylase RimI-like enzyme